MKYILIQINFYFLLFVIHKLHLLVQNFKIMAYKILLVEDEVNLAKAILLNLELEEYNATWIKNGTTANFTLLSKPNYFDLIILDVMLPEKDGFEICKNLRKAEINTPVLFLSARNSAEDKIKGLRHGADDYLGKPFNLEELLLRIEILLKRKTAQNSPVLNDFIFSENRINFNNQLATTFKGDVIKITTLEKKLLQLLVSKQGIVVSRDKIIDEIWAGESIKGRSIDNLISRFRKWFEKDPKSPVHFISTRGIGYRFQN